jgi:membrane carboxypeptidase/penicillin-binding protein
VVNAALLLIQEGLRGVVRMPSGTAHSLDSRQFPIAVMGKTGTTNEFRDALFVGSTYGPGGITIAVRIGFDDNRSLGSRETGGRVALPVFREIMLRVYGEKLAGAAPEFPREMEQRIDSFLGGGVAVTDSSSSLFSCGHRAESAQDHHGAQTGMYLLVMPCHNAEGNTAD